MTREEYEKLSAALLKDFAKKRGIRGISAMRKSEVAALLAEADSAAAAAGQQAPEAVAQEPAAQQAAASGKQASAEDKDMSASAGAKTDPAGAGEKESAGGQTKSRAQEGAQTRRRNASERRTSQTRRSEAGGQRAAEHAEGRQRTAQGQAQQARPAAQGQAQQARFAAQGQAQQARTDAVQVQAQQARPAGVHGQAQQARPAAAQGQTQQARSDAAQGQMQQARPAAVHGQPQQARPAGMPGQGGADRLRLSRQPAPMTRGELRQSNPQPKAAERPENAQERAEGDRPPMELKQLDSGNTVSGVLEVMSDGYGFIRSNNYLPGEDDIYVSPSQIRRFNLKTGDIICGNTRVHAQQEKFSALLFVKTINGYLPSEAAKRYNFEDMTPIFPNSRLRMERTGREIAMRIVDILSPIGKGQRGLIVSPPKAGKTTLLKDIARSIQRNNPEMHIIIMLIDERPEEVTDIREAIVGENVEVLDSTFDETPEHHKRVAEMGIERAKRLVEHNRDVVILLDSITRLARAYNLIVPPSGRTLSGGLDPAALHPPKRFFGAARNMREGGSLTILATALVDTGSKMDDVVYEEFKGTGNMELILDRKLSERRVFPAIDIMKSGTRREDLLLTTDEGEASYVMRRAMNGMKGDDAVERILDMFARTRSNEELIQRIKHSHVI